MPAEQNAKSDMLEMGSSMADLMTSTYTYEGLTKQYGEFCVPIVRIKMNNIDLTTTMDLTVTDVTVKLSIEAVNMVQFKLIDIYDMQSHSFDKKIKNKFLLGSVVEVEVGYLSAAKKIFKGFVSMIGAEFGEIPKLVITLMDVRRLMMLSGKKHLFHDVKNYSDAFRKVMSDYSMLCSVEIDATKDKLENPVSQTQNDFLFVMKELIQKGRVEREFFVLADKAYFRKPRKVKQPVMILTYGKELLELSTQECFFDLKYEVIGYDAESQMPVTGKATAEHAKTQKRLYSKTPTVTITDPTADTQQKVNEQATTLAQNKERERCFGWGKTIGLPELVPGRYVQVKGLEKDFADKKYYLKEVTHEINGEHFQTRFEIGGWL